MVLPGPDKARDVSPSLTSRGPAKMMSTPISAPRATYRARIAPAREPLVSRVRACSQATAGARMYARKIAKRNATMTRHASYTKAPAAHE